MVDFRTKQDKVFDTVNVALLSIILLITAYPVYFVIMASFSDPSLVATGNVVLRPRGITFEAYRFVFSDRRIMLGYRNSFLYAAGQTIISLLLTIPAAYALSRKDMKGRSAIMMYMVFTLYFSGGMIPFYVLMRRIGLNNNVLALMLPNAVNVFNIIIARTFFLQNIPDEMLESAQMDGCSNTRFFFQIAVPLSRAVIAIIVLFNVVQVWNAWFHAMLFINTQAKYPLQLILRKVLILGQTMTSADDLSWMSVEELARRQFLTVLLRYAIIVVAVAPLLIIYPFIQKHFVRGIMVGSIKG